MGRTSKEELARREGMSYALKVAKEKGLDGLEDELKRRQAYDIPIKCSQKDLDKLTNNIKENMSYYFKILVCVTLHDEYGMGGKRLQRFMDRFDLKVDCLAEDFTTWEEQISILAEECNLVLEEIDDKDVNVKV